MKKPRLFNTVRYGWQRDLPDHRDFLYAAPSAALVSLPTAVDLRPQCPPVYDQGQLGSCTAGAIQFDQRKSAPVISGSSVWCNKFRTNQKL